MTRTSLSVAVDGVEVIQGGMFPWMFRPHYHDGQEVVSLLAGRARLQLPETALVLGAGDSVVVPARVVHRFEPIDGIGWAFASRFVRQKERPNSIGLGPATLSGRVIDILSTRSSLQSNIGDIAQACSLSAGYIARVFRREMGSSLHNFHVVFGLHKAKLLLRDGMGVVEAALEAGFYDQAHLNREFVRTFGMTPGMFRSAWRQAGC